MDNAPEVVRQRVTVFFKTTKADNPKADSDRRVVVTGLSRLRAADFVREFLILVPHWKSVEYTENGETVVDVQPYSLMTKYELDDKVTTALQNIDISIGHA